MIDYGDLWHDPRGPQHQPGAAEEGVEFVKKAYADALDARIIAAARAAGMSEEQIAAILGRPSPEEAAAASARRWPFNNW